MRVGDPAFGLETLTYSVGSVQPNRPYLFEISGIRLKGGPPRTYRYTTTLYDCDPQAPPRPAPLTEGLGIPPSLLWQVKPFNSLCGGGCIPSLTLEVQPCPPPTS